MRPPAPQDGKVVVYVEHFAQGLGLPVSRFFFHFLMHYGLQPHHLAAYAVLQLAAFVTLCKGFLGIEQLSVTDKATGEKWMNPREAALVHHRSGYGFPKLPL
ncbi:hypothetical protein D1007_30473 [Hordeum vulgare]|nr:hypothetical protein D1007_30473 [Hordeum vulgare]